MLTEKAIWSILEEVCDPEIPVLSIADLGIIRQIHVYTTDNTPHTENLPHAPESIEVVITPTYSGCPAMNTIAAEIIAALKRHGAGEVRVRTVLSPPWTTDWISTAGRDKLLRYGIAPPIESTGNKRVRALLGEEDPHGIVCPHCASADTQIISRFGSTACKALYKCNTCLEPFDYFKCH